MEWVSYIFIVFQLASLALMSHSLWRTHRYFYGERESYKQAGVEAAMEISVFWIAVGIRQERNRWLRAVVTGTVAEEVANSRVD